MNTKAVIDVGTNSIKLLVMRKNGGTGDVLSDRNDIVRLGEGVRMSGALSREAMERAVSAIGGMAEEAVRLGADDVAVVGTQALRAASNTDDFIGSVRMRTGLTLEVIDGETEADLSFLAALSALEGGGANCRALCMFDVGGGSSEIVAGDVSGGSFRCSLPAGALTLHDMFFRHVERAEENRTAIARAEQYMGSLLAEAGQANRKLVSKEGESGCCVGIGGTIATLASVMLALETFDAASISGAKLDLTEIERQIALFARALPEERSRIQGLDAKRADIILAGACIVREMLVYFGFPSMMVSGRGLRYGVMMKRFGLC